MFNILQKKAKAQASDRAQLAEFKIGGMHCVSCGLNIDGELEDLEGVTEATTSYAKATTRVFYDPSRIDETTIRKTIEKTGYQIEK